jgi:hypothetical protein
MSKYNKSKIYKIISNQEPFFFYIGSTVSDLNIRLNRHKSDSKIHPNSKKNKYFSSINWDVNICLIEEKNFSSSSELHIYENEFIKKYINDDLCLNTYYAKVNNDIRKQKSLVYGKKYYTENIDEIRKKHNDYYLKTKKEKIKKYEESKDIINQKRREKIMCECGITISRGYHSQHIKSKCHTDALKEKIVS